MVTSVSRRARARVEGGRALRCVERERGGGGSEEAPLNQQAGQMGDDREKRKENTKVLQDVGWGGCAGRRRLGCVAGVGLVALATGWLQLAGWLPSLPRPPAACVRGVP